MKNSIFNYWSLAVAVLKKLLLIWQTKMFQRGYQVKIAYLYGEVVVRPENREIELVYLGLESVKNSKSGL